MKPTDANHQKPALSLSGDVYTTEEVQAIVLAGENIESLPDPSKDHRVKGDYLASGDLKVFPKLDEEGRMALSGGHTNYGYSGYFSASIFDGAKWRRFDLRTIVPENESAFAAQMDKPRTIERIRKRVHAASGRQCVWTVPEGKKQGRYMATPSRQG